jgi:hypothetical protein
MQARVLGLAGGRMFGVGALGVVARWQIFQLTASQTWCRSCSWRQTPGLASRQTWISPTPVVMPPWAGPGLADGMAVPAQAMVAQHLHDGVALGSAHLQHHAELLVEQRLQRELVAPGLHLRRPVLAVAHLGAAVADAVALGDQHVHVQRHAHMAGEGHLADRGEQAAVAAVMVGQQQAPAAQGVHGGHQAHQVLRVVQVGHHVATCSSVWARMLPAMRRRPRPRSTSTSVLSATEASSCGVSVPRTSASVANALTIS